MKERMDLLVAVAYKNLGSIHKWSPSSFNTPIVTPVQITESTSKPIHL